MRALEDLSLTFLGTCGIVAAITAFAVFCIWLEERSRR